MHIGPKNEEKYEKRSEHKKKNKIDILNFKCSIL